MVDIKELSESDKGREVVYEDVGRREYGKISSWNDTYIFVRFTSGDTAAACRPGDLEFADE